MAAVLTLEDLKNGLAEAVEGRPAPWGLGVRAYSRAGPAFFLEGFRLLCARWTEDIPYLRALAPVHCLEEDHAPVDCGDTLALLRHPALARLGLRPPANQALLVYQDNPGLHALAARSGWQLLAGDFRIRTKWENKAWFRRRLQKAGFPVPPGILVEREAFVRSTYEAWRGELGAELVVQIPDFPRGGGRATCLVSSAEGWDRLRRQWQGGRHRDHPIRQVLVSARVPGPSLSLQGCVTSRAVLASPIQQQLLDLPEVLPAQGWGRFCGHQWGGIDCPPQVEHAAGRMLNWVGTALAAEGYRGLFGLDLAWDREEGRVFAVECNPRYTAAFPTLTLLQCACGLPPLEGFHLGAWLDDTALCPAEDLEDRYRAMPPAAQVYLFHREEAAAKGIGHLPPGRYRWNPQEGHPQRMGEPFPPPPPPWNPREFVVLDGPPPSNYPLRPGHELDLLMRIVFFDAVVAEDHRALTPFAGAVVDWAYGSLGLCHA
jgi:hypothetical protein